jgi:hypothetical protein
VAQRSWTIGIRPTVGAEPRKITKVVSLKDGGFSVLTPYHQSQSGYLAKIPMPVGVGPHFIRWSEGVTFTAESRVKLSYHADGFAQFSGETSSKIISGIDQVTGKPKGLGVRTNPLTRPTWSGAAVSIAIWGIEEYLTCRDRDSETTVYEPEECYYRNCSPDEADGWVLTLHTFSKRPPLPIRFRNKIPFLQVQAENSPSNPLGFIVEYRVIDLPGPVVLGLNLNRIVTKVMSKSGWILNGPSDAGADGEMRYGLTAVYPRSSELTASEGPLDRNEATVSREC